MQITDKFEIVPVAEIKPDERNARKHSDEQIMELRRSLREFGFVNPLLIDKNKKRRDAAFLFLIAQHAIMKKQYAQSK